MPGYHPSASAHPAVDNKGTVLAANLVGAPAHGVALVGDLHLAHGHMPHADLPTGGALAEFAFEVLVVRGVGCLPCSLHPDGGDHQGHA